MITFSQYSIMSLVKKQKNNKNTFSTVMPAKSDSDVMFCLHINRGLRIDGSLVFSSNPQDRINTQVIY